MPDKVKFSQIKSMLSSLSKAVADYEMDYGGDSAYEENPYDDKDSADGGQDTEVLSGFTQTSKQDASEKGKSQGTSGEAKKKKMSMMSAMLKKKVGNY